MVNFIVGIHGSGKTGFLIEKVLSSEEGRSEMLIVPRQITFLTDERLLNTLGAVKASEIEVLSFKRLCDNVMKSIAGVAKKPLRDGVNTMIMLRVLNELKYALKVYGDAPDLVLAGQLLSEIRRFKTGCVSAEDIRNAKTAGAEKLNDKLDDLALIFDRYDAAVSKEYFDENDLLDEIYKILLSESFFDGKIIAFDGFSSYTKQQMRLIALAAKSAKDVYITVSSDNIDGLSIASPFSYVNNSVKRLKRVIKEEIGETEFNIISMEKENPAFTPYKSKDIAVLAENIFRRDSKIPAANDGIRLFSAGSIDGECDFVAREIKKLLRKGEYRCRDIAVSFRNFGTYPVRLANSFRKYDVPFFEDRRQPIVNSPLIILVSALLELSVPRHFSDDAIFKYLKSGLAGISEDEISRLENYAFIWSLSGDDFKAPFKKNPLGFSNRFNEEDKTALSELNGIRERFIMTIESFVNSVSNASGREYCAAIYYFLINNRIDAALKEYAISLEKAGDTALALEQGEIWDALMELLDDIADTIGESIVEPKMFFELFTLAVQSKTLGRLPSHFDEVTLCSFDRLVNYMPKVLFSVGCNDGIFPLYSSADSVFTESERQLLLEKQGSLNIVEDETDNVIYEHFLMYHAVSSATEKLFLTCSDMDTKGHSLQPSDIFSIIKRCLSGLDFEVEDNSLENMAQSEDSAYEYYLRHFNENTSEIKSLELYFSNREDYAGRTELMKRMISGEPFRIRDRTIASGLFGERMSLSASKVEDYESCPFKFFCNYGLKAKEREKAKFDSRNIGSAAHEILEKLLSSHVKSDFTDKNESILNDEIEKLLYDYLEEKMYGEDDKTKRFLYLYYRVKKMLSVTLKRIIKQFALTPFEPVAFEKRIGNDSEIPSLKIPLENGYIEINGIIDRIDEARIDDSVFVNIVDYKTSKSKEFNLSDVLEGINLQMVIYLMAICEGGFKGEKPLPAGVLYSIVNGEPVKESNAKINTLEKNFYEKMLRGMILEDISAYFGNGADKVFPVSNSYTSDDFDLLSKRVKRIIAEMGEKLHNGEIPALSYIKGKGPFATTPCNWCPYKSVCAKSEHGKENIRRINKQKFSETLESLREEAENA